MTTGYRLDFGRVPQEQSDGTPYSGGQLRVLANLTTTPLTLYSDRACTTPAANPVVADSAGRLPMRYIATSVLMTWSFYTAADTLFTAAIWSDNYVEAFLGSLAGFSVSGPAAALPFIETDQVAPAGAWEWIATGGQYKARRNTAVALDFTTYTDPITIKDTDVVDFPQTPTVLDIPIVTRAGVIDALMDVAAPYLGQLYGLTLANNGSDATNDIDVAIGLCSDVTGVKLLALTSALTKRSDAVWGVGTNAGWLDTGAIGNGVYHVYLIMRSDTGVVDCLLSLSASAPTMPTAYDYKRRIGSIIRSAGAILAFSQFGDEFLWTTPILDIDVTAAGTAAVSRTLTVPTGLNVVAIFNVFIEQVASDFSVYLSALDQADLAPSNSAAPLNNLGSTLGGAEGRFAAMFRIRTNTSAQIRTRQSASAAGDIFRIATLGWIDLRGK